MNRDEESQLLFEEDMAAEGQIVDYEEEQEELLAIQLARLDYHNGQA